MNADVRSGNGLEHKELVGQHRAMHDVHIPEPHAYLIKTHHHESQHMNGTD